MRFRAALGAGWLAGVAVGALGSEAAAQAAALRADSTASQSPPPFCCDRPKFFVAAAEVLALQVVPWYFNRYVSDDTTAALSPTSWRRHIQRGFEWDNNAFPTAQPQ
jgi:hypothetical protein